MCFDTTHPYFLTYLLTISPLQLLMLFFLKVHVAHLELPLCSLGYGHQLEHR